MSAAEKLEAISDRLTWKQICERHPDEWVCLVEIEYAQLDDAIEQARVVGHGKTKREPVEQAKAWWGQYATIGHFYTGKLRAPSPRFRVIVEDETRDPVHLG
jgi:hypothetical protein